MVNCCIGGCIVAGTKRKLLSGNIILCNAHYIDLFEIIFTEECNNEEINSDSVARALVQITVSMESKPIIESILAKQEKDNEDEDLSLETGFKSTHGWGTLGV